jgi:hypothetical protein
MILYQIVGNHLTHNSMKMYEHEVSLCDDMFKGAITYEEILDRVQALSLELQTIFLTFQKHRRSGLPKTLQGESTTPPPVQESIPLDFGSEARDKGMVEENPKKVEAPSQKEKSSQIEHSELETEVRLETRSKSS